MKTNEKKLSGKKGSTLKGLKKVLNIYINQ